MMPLEPLLRHRRLVLGVYLLITLAAATGLPLLKIDNSPEVFFVDDAQALWRYERFQRAFGRDRAVRIALHGPGLWTEAGLSWLGELEQQVADLYGVMGTTGLWGYHHRWFATWPPPDPTAFRARVLLDPIDRQAGWVSPDGETVSLLAVLYRLPPERQRRLLSELDALAATAPPGLEVRMIGLPWVQRALDQAVVTFGSRFFPWLVALAVTILALAFRRAHDVLAPLLVVAVCQITVLGLMGHLGQPFDMVLVVLIPLIFVITLATAVHVLMRLRHHRERGLSASSATLETYREKGWAVFWTGATTWVGFGSLAVGDAPPVRALGVWAAFAIAFMTLTMFTLYPAILAGHGTGGGNRPGTYERHARRLGRSWAVAAMRRRKATWTIFGTLAVLSLLGLTRLHVEARMLTYLRRDHPVRSDFEWLERQGISAVAAEVVVSRPRGATAEGPPPFLRAQDLEGLKRLAAELSRQPGVLGAVSAGDLLDGMVRAELPEAAGGDPSQRERALETLRTQPDTAMLLAALLTPDGSRARISVFVPTLGFRELGPLFEHLAERTHQAFPGAEVWITGRYPLILAAQRTLLRTMLLALSLTLASVALIFRWVLGSLRLTVLALIPNLLPVAFVLAVMGALAVPLDSSTVMIASVVLGLAVDDTLHTLGQFRRLAGSLGPLEAAAATLERTAPAHALTTAILAAGFGICGLSAFVPIARFGALTALALLMALAADLLLVPSLLGALPARQWQRLALESSRQG